MPGNTGPNKGSRVSGRRQGINEPWFEAKKRKTRKRKQMAKKSKRRNRN